MNPAIWSIIQLAIAIAKSQVSFTAADKIDEATALGRIAILARQAYKDQVGKPLDEALIKPEAPIQ